LVLEPLKDFLEHTVLLCEPMNSAHWQFDNDGYRLPDARPEIFMAMKIHIVFFWVAV